MFSFSIKGCHENNFSPSYQHCGRDLDVAFAEREVSSH